LILSFLKQTTMILLIHMLFGAVIASYIKNPILAIILAFLSHYFLDIFPHIEYSIENINQRNWKKSLPDFSRVFLDFLLGIILIYFLSDKNIIIFIAAFFAILPDGISILSPIIKTKILEYHNEFHQKKIHFLKYKKIPVFWRIFTQIFIFVISVFLLIR
jgi:hypothetical protein